jgi:sugar (pentulose or hexulose) kinase
MSKRFFLGIDTGTSVVKAVLIDIQGSEIAVSEENTPVETQFEGWSEFDLYEDWKSVARAIRKLFKENRVSPEEITAVGVTGKGWGCCYLDKNKEPLRKGILWNDARSTTYIQNWKKSGVLSEAFGITGNYYYTGDCGPVTRWFIDNEPAVARQVATITFPPAWIVYNLTGELKLVKGDVSSLYNIKKRSYSDEVFNLLGISDMREKFPAPISSTEVAGEVTRKAAEMTGLKIGTPVVLAEFDASSCATGVGVIQNGTVCIILGTAHVVSISLDEPIFAPENGLIMTYIDNKYLKLIPPVIATPNVEWYLQNFCHRDYEEAEADGIDVFTHLDGKLEEIPPGADGIIYHPYLSPIGERSPFSKPTAKGNFFGLGLHHTRHHLMRAIYEGVVFSAYDCMLASKVEIQDIMLSGGGAKSEIWGKIEADIIGKPVKKSKGKEFAAKGAVITAMVATGIYPDYNSAFNNTIKIEKVFQPDRENHDLYKQYFQIYRSIVKHLWDDWDKRYEILRRHGKGLPGPGADRKDNGIEDQKVGA